MAGHSKWHNIKHRKAAVDKKRGRIWTKIAKAIIVAAKHGGPDPESNLTLRYAIDEARYANMPRDTIERAVKKGAGGGDTDNYEAIRYEGYAPGGVAVIVDALTDNRTRTITDLRTAFGAYGGNVGSSGCVSYLFQSRGQIFASGTGVSDEEMMELAIEAGALDVEPPEEDDSESPVWSIITHVADFNTVKDKLEQAKLHVIEAQLVMLPETLVAVRAEHAKQVMALIDEVEDLDDVQKVYSNADIPDEVLS